MNKAILPEELDAVLEELLDDPNKRKLAKDRLREKMVAQDTVRIFPATRYASDDEDFFDNIPV